jgi:uncharacterized protein YidB (DUF937 family)
MLDSILSGLKNQIAGELVSKAGIKDSQIDDIIKVAGESTKEVMTNKLSPDMLGDVMNLFSKGKNSGAANGIQNDLINSFVGNLISKLGISDSMAKTISATAIPKIIEMITGENEKTPASDASALLNMFGGGDSISDSLKGTLGNTLGGLFK